MDKPNKKGAAEWIGLTNKFLFTVQGLLFLAIAVYKVTQTCVETTNYQVPGKDIQFGTMCNIAIFTTVLAVIQLGIAALVLIWFKTYIKTIFLAITCYVIYPAVFPSITTTYLVVNIYNETDIHVMFTLCGIVPAMILVQIICIIILKCHKTKDCAQEADDEKLSKRFI